MSSSVRKLLLWLSAADSDVLERCPGEQTRFVTAGGAVLTTTAMAMLAGYFMAHTLLHIGVFGSLLFGAGWALAIMNLERYVQSSIRRQRVWWMTLLMATPRVGLAILLGLVISNPLLLKVFQSEVRTQIRLDKDTELASARKALNKQFAAVPRLQAKEAELERELDTPSPVGEALGNSPEYHSLAQRYGIFRAEGLEGAAAATLAQMEPLRAQLLQQEESDDKTREAEEKQKLQATRQELGPIQVEFDARNKALKEAFPERSGLADHMRALSVLVSSNAQVAFIKDVLMLFILAVDSLPALLKMLMCMGRPSLYEIVQDSDERAAASTVEAEESLACAEAQRASEEQLHMQAEIGKARVAKRIEVQMEMDAMSIEVMEETIRPQVERWARKTAERYARELAAELDRRPPSSRERPGQARTTHAERRAGRYRGRFKRL